MTSFERCAAVGDRVRVMRGAYAGLVGTLKDVRSVYAFVESDAPFRVGAAPAVVHINDLERIAYTLTTSGPHHHVVGDVIDVDFGGAWFVRALRLLRRPRLRVVAEVTRTTATVIERRMTWPEWRAAWARLLGL
jgi:hypothetical protein